MICQHCHHTKFIYVELAPTYMRAVWNAEQDRFIVHPDTAETICEHAKYQQIECAKCCMPVHEEYVIDD